MRTRRSQESTILLVTVLNVCVHAAIAAAQIDFAEPQFYADPGAFRIAAGDLNGDGAIDIVVASCCPNDQVRILFNSGDGALSAPVVVSTVTPTAICTGDLDDDGDLEIIIGDYWLGSVRILLNNGNGTFTFESSWPVGVEPLSIAVGDMNGDRDPDLVVTSAGFYGEPGDVTVLFNDGGAIFSESQTYSTMGLFPAFVSIGDIDSDADLDVVVSNSDSWALFQNNGDGTLSEPVLTPSDAPRQCLLNDYDGDGDVDLAVRRGDVADIFLNDGSGMFGEPVSYALGSGQDVMEAGDLDGDGDLDLLAANNPDDDVSILLNNGDGTFADEIGLFVGNGPQDAVIADLNSDGALDFAVCNGAGDNVAILLNERGLAQCPGDTNASGVVDVLDLVAVIVDWGTDGSGNSGDINGSGIVDVGDLIAVINGWGPCPEATAACCLPDGSCNELSEDGCSTAGGTPSPGEVCGSPQACCLGDSTCELLDPLCCGALGGVSQGSGSTCQPNPCVPAPANDECADAAPLQIGASVIVNTTNATDDPQSTDFCGTNNVNQAVWYRVIGDGNDLQASICNPGTELGFDTKIQVWTGDCGDLVCVAGNDDDITCFTDPLLSNVFWCSEPGQEYLIAVGGFGDEFGIAELSIDTFGPCAGGTPVE